MSRFEEYELFVNNTQRLSERRQVATQSLLTVNTILFSVLAFLVKDARFEAWGLVLVSFPLFCVGLLACNIWLRILSQFRTLSNWRYEQLRVMEQSMPDCFCLFSKEWEACYKPSDAKHPFGFARLELWLPMMFTTLYVGYGVGIVVATILGYR